MRMRLFTTFIIVLCPFLLSFDPTVYDSSYFAKYESAEGILFLSYSDKWNEQKLKELYEELIRNRHGRELFNLREVRVQAGNLRERPHSDFHTRGQFHALTNTITLYKGDTTESARDYREPLSHEYGHFFAYYYLRNHHFPFTPWNEARKLREEPINWTAFLNYQDHSHQWYPQEIFADDYVLLYGTTRKIDVEDVFTNEAFYTRTMHENQQIANVLELSELHEYLSQVTGLQVDPSRLLKKPTLIQVKNQQISFSITPRKDVAYRLNLSYFLENNEKTNHIEEHKITSSTIKDIISFQVPREIEEGSFNISIDAVDLNTSIGVRSETYSFQVHNNIIIE